VGGHQVSEPILLADGDVITTGIVELTFRLVHPEVPTESVR
jgi:hypothetical protein